jgi:type I restriction enzyme, S subunit
MSTDLFFEKFAMLATAPEGIARLRELILQLAAQGKLGTHDDVDDPARILTRRIRDSKNESSENTRKKKQNFGDPIDLDDVNLSTIPKGWTICRLSDCLELINGRAYSMPELLSQGTPIIRIQNLNGGKDWYYSDLNLEPDKYCDNGDLLFAWSGTFGPYIWNGSKSIYHYHIWKIKLSDLLFDRFTFYLLKHLSDRIRSSSHGLMILHMTKQNMENVLIRLPPLAEQHRIVAKVDRLMALCDELEGRQQQERAGCLKLGTASLAGLQEAIHPEEFGQQWAQVCDTFDLILDCPENVKVLRQTIFQLAVKGRLTRQELGDEPANLLLEKIKKEKERLISEGKIKREKPLDPINITKAPHHLPKLWTIAYLNDVCELVADPDHNMPKAVDHGTKFISAKDLRDDGTINFKINVKYISDEDYSRLARKIQPKFGDIIFSRIGSIGKSCIVKTTEKFMISYSCCIIRPLMVDTNYLNYFLKEASFLTIALEKTQGIGVPDLGMKMIKQFIVPLPPLAEQHRIVAKVDALMTLCDALEAQLKERAGIQNKFADAVVKNVGTR